MKLLSLLSALLISAALPAQSNVKVERNLRAPLAKVIDFSDTSLQNWEPTIYTLKEQPRPSNDEDNKKAYLDSLRTVKKGAEPKTMKSSRNSNVPAPIMLNNFMANTPSAVPNDNHMAISDSGLIVSVVNLNLKVTNDTGHQLYYKNLTAFAVSLGILQNLSDPRVIYDPEQDRFIVIFFAGVISTYTNIVVAFSQTNNPTGEWNFYKLSGNLLNDSTWSDYPIVTISDSDLFMTFNHLQDDSFFPAGFKYSVIWQIDKSLGYAGDTLQFNYFHDIQYQGAPIWNVCAIQNGSFPTGPESYFLSVRPHDLINDTVFLHTISNTYSSGNAQFSTKVLTTSPAYGYPPDALQKGGGSTLATNDARILSGFYQNDRIQYVQNTVDTANVSAAVYVGEIDNISSTNPTATGQLITSDTIDFGFPSIAYLGNDAFDNRAVITCSYSPTDTFAGTVAFYKDAGGNISDMLIVQKGETKETALTDSVQRWGDYTGIQKKYNESNVAWLCGSYVAIDGNYSTWIAKIVNPDSSTISSVPIVPQSTSAKVFPNPTSEKFSLQIDLPRDNFTRFSLYNEEGQLIRVLLDDYFTAGTNLFSFNTQYLSSGIYFLRITDRGSLLKTEKIVISR